jgi:nitrogen fixation protein FixH
MKRRLLAIALGITFLILMTWIGTIITSVVPQRVTAQVQTAQAGPYQVTLQVNPNPPPITQPATLSIQILEHNSKRPVSSAKVTLESNMVTMEMGTGQVEAKPQHDGTYLASVQFSMSGPWQVQVVISMPGESQTFNATFDVAAQ